MKIVIYNRIKQKIDEYKQKTGISKTFIAENLGMSTQGMYYLMKTTNLSLETLIKVSFVLNCNITDLITYTVEDDETNEWIIKSGSKV